MRRLALLAALGLAAALATGAAAADADQAFHQWQDAFAAVDRRVGHGGVLREALDEAARARPRMEALAGACRDRTGSLSSLESHVRFLREESESAQREAKRCADARDAKHAQLMEEARAWNAREHARLEPIVAALKARDDALAQRRAEIHAWRDRIAPQMRTYQIPDEQAGYQQALAAKAELDAAVDRFNEDLAAFQRDDADNDADIARTQQGWEAQLARVEAFVLEEGRAALAAQAVASKKEAEYREAEAKLTALSGEQDRDTAELAGLLAGAQAAVQRVQAALAAPPPVVSTAALASEPYVVQHDAAAATAAALPAPDGAASAAAAAPDGVLVLPPPTSAAVQPDPVELLRRRLVGEALARRLADESTALPAAPVVAIAPAAPAPAGVVAPLSVGTAPIVDIGAGDDGSAVVVLSDEALHRAFDPRVFISEEQYREALATHERYAELPAKLQRVLDAMRRQRGHLLGESREFDEVRAELARGTVRDLLSVYATAAGPLLEHLAKDPRYAARLTPVVLDRIKLAFAVARMEVGRRHAPLAADPDERRKQELEVLDTGVEALVTVCTGGLGADTGSAQLLEQMGNLLKVYSKTSRYLLDPKTGERPRWEEIGEGVRTGIDVAAVYCPPIALGVGVESLGERGLGWAITQDAVDSLSASIASTDDAIVLLASRRDAVRERLDRADRLIADYRAAEPARRRSLRIVPPPP